MRTISLQCAQYSNPASSHILLGLSLCVLFLMMWESAPSLKAINREMGWTVATHTMCVWRTLRTKQLFWIFMQLVRAFRTASSSCALQKRYGSQGLQIVGLMSGGPRILRRSEFGQRVSNSLSARYARSELENLMNDQPRFLDLCY